MTFASHPAEAEAVAEGCAEAGGRLTPFVLVDPSTEAGLAAGRRALGDLGFRHDAAQVVRAERKSGTFKGLAEYVFQR